MPIGLRGLSVNNYMLAYEQAPRQPYIRFRSDRHLGALPATHKNTHLRCSQKWSKTYAACGLKIENRGAKKTATRRKQKKTLGNQKLALSCDQPWRRTLGRACAMPSRRTTNKYIYRCPSGQHRTSKGCNRRPRRNAHAKRSRKHASSMLTKIRKMVTLRLMVD